MKNKYIQVYVSCEKKQQATVIAKALLTERFVACAQILPAMESFYHWQGQIERSDECLLILKTRYDCFHKVEQLIIKEHSYQLPEIIAVPICCASPEYLKWIDEEIID